MGSFSWCYCDVGEIRIDSFGCPRPRRDQRLVGFSKDHPASVLIPEEFGGKTAQIDVKMYEDYGRFGKIDIYNLIADWNRSWISAHPDYKTPHSLKYEEQHPKYPAKKMSEYPWWPFYSNLSLSREDVLKKWREAYPCTPLVMIEYRSIGITIACYNEDNAALPYPIKIAKDPRSIYEDCPPSLSDPYQGFD